VPRTAWRGRTIRYFGSHDFSAISRRRALTGAAAATWSAFSGKARAAGLPEPVGVAALHARPSGYEGFAPGPPLRVRRGEELQFRLVNELAEPTAIHWHGVRLANAMDGSPPLTQEAVAPGSSFDYRFTAPDAGTFWYHAPSRKPPGLYGALIVSETEPVDVDHDVSLIFAVESSAAGVISWTLNGAPTLDIAAQTNERLRLRFLNAAPSQILNLRIGGLRTFVMATDGQPAEPFAARDGRLSLGPGNRVDAFVDCTLLPDGTVPVTIEGIAAPIAHIVCRAGTADLKAPRPDPHPLPPNGMPERMDFAAALRFDGVGTRAGVQSKDPIFRVKRGRTVLLRPSNPTSENVCIHLHGHSFRLLDALDDGWKPFWLDTLPLAPGTDARIAFVADNPGKWLIEGFAGKQGVEEAWFEVI
jgi:FtsP/CotA-like multicopper oxidase with cupredoxin domain